MKIKKITVISTAAVAVLAACGGGGGSGGESHAPYKITLRTEKTQLPVNIGGVQAGTGVYSPFTTTLYVEAKENGNPIPGGEEIFACNVAGGLDVGSLYYLDGDPEHEKEIDDGNGGTTTIPLAYRNITLGANAGGASFHFHAKTQAGTATITCAVTDPRDKTSKSTSVNIVVGGATGKPASIKTVSQYDYLGTQGNQNNIRTASTIQAFVLDDANQPVPTSVNANLQVAIASGSASAGARLFVGPQGGNVVRVNTNGGVGTFTLSSGVNEGTILIEMTTDRADNDVTNGIQEPIVQLFAVPVTTGTAAGSAPDPVFLDSTNPSEATNGIPYSYAFSATGGTAPYTWAALGTLPEGLSLDASGVLAGTPNAKLPGTYPVAIRATDRKGISATGNFTISVAGTAAGDPTTNPLSITLANCTNTNVNTICQLPDAPVGDFYQFVLTTTGGGSGAVTWSIDPSSAPINGWTTIPTNTPGWLRLSNTGVLQGNVPATCGALGNPFFIRATKGTGTNAVTTMRRVTIRGVTGTGGTCAP